MCGILGIASRSAIEHRDWLADGREALQHRGPDDAGEWWEEKGRVGLGHRRLAILDLSPAGHQPMLDPTDGSCIAFNGEIYNFGELRDELRSRGETFTSQSDTEVILAAYRVWGTQCLDRFNGMFAFALYDAPRQQLFLARDRAGEKPIFYAIANESIRFASELKGLMADGAWPRRMNAEALDCYFAGGFVPGDRCIVQGVNKLPPAHALVFDLQSGQHRTWRYWQPPEFEPGAEYLNGQQGGLIDELENLLELAVARQLVADVPVGVLLSGGVDSSLVTAMAARSSPNVRTFTIRFPEHPAHDETQHARTVAQHFGTEHVELEAESTTLDLLAPLSAQFDEPIIDSSMIPTFLVSRLVRPHCTVALGGDGGDELFGGYSMYDRLLRMQRAVAMVPRPLRVSVARAAKLLPFGLKGRNWCRALGIDFTKEVPIIATYFDRSVRKRLLRANGSWNFVAEEIHKQRTPSASDLLQRVTRMDFENYLPEDILVKIDRASMLNSLEVRAPMLDRHVMEFAFRRVPHQLKTTPARRKVLLKQLGARVLPATFDWERKQGFSIPLDSWLETHQWKSYFREVLLDTGQTILSHDVIQDLLDRHGSVYKHGERLFGLVMFELWRREYQLQL